MDLNKMFPETNLIKCVFSLRQSNVAKSPQVFNYDKYDHTPENITRNLKKYTYRVSKDLKDKLKKGDMVVVHCSTGYQIAEVTDFDVLSSFSEESFAPVVCKVDLTSYLEEVDKKEARDLLKSKIEAEKKRLESMITYDLIAEKNPGFKAMLDAYKEMGGEF